MKVLGIDVGCRHLSFCLIASKELEILRWELYDLEDEDNGRLPERLKTLLYREWSPEYVQSVVHRVIIENQPGGKYRNVNPSTVGAMLHFYFDSLLASKFGHTLTEVSVLSGSLKFQKDFLLASCCEIKKRSYSERKRLSIRLCKFLIPRFSGLILDLDQFKKKDDICDSFLMAVGFIQKTIGGVV